MNLEGSQIPAELRVNQLMGRIEGIGIDQVSKTNTIPGAQGPNFKAVASMMQSQMMGESLVNPQDSKSTNPLSSLMGMNQLGMMGMMSGPGMQNMSPQIMQMMMGGQANPMQASLYGNPMASQMAMMQGFPGGMPENMVFPLKGQISSEYGERRHPTHGHKHFHSGLDIAAPEGSAIRMPYSGKVVFVGPVTGFGNNTVVVAHENQIQDDGKILYSVFGHNENVFVEVGEHVKQGEIFATVGSEGNSTGPHLHWETRVAPAGLVGTEIFEQNLSMTVNPMDLA